jgi:uncharacterized membrane protein
MQAGGSTNGGGRAERSVLLTGVILGVGVVGSLDEIVLHQVLQWHNFYVDTSDRWRIVIDGVFHFVMAALLFAGALRLWDGRRDLGALGAGRALAAGILLGMGGFNLFDGTVNHKLLQVHPVREGVSPQWPYDIVYNALAIALLLAGWLLWRGVRSARSVDARERRPAPARR